MTITVDRARRSSTSARPYYYTPAQMAASTASGITTLDGLAGKTVCVGRAHDLRAVAERHAPVRAPAGPGATPPAGVKVQTLATDTDCPDQWQAGRNDFEGWLSSITTVEGAIKAGLPMVKVGDPVFFEPLAVAVDKSGPTTPTSCRCSSRSSPTCTPDGYADDRVPEVVRGRLHAGARLAPNGGTATPMA